MLQGIPACDVDQSDAHSHFALRLAHCQDKDRRQWFIRNECALMVERFEDLEFREKAESTLAGCIDMFSVCARTAF